jgi:hypothetical protein
VAAVLRRRAPLVAAALAFVAAVIALALVLLLRGGDDAKQAAPTTAEPLAYLPAGADDLVFDLDTREPLLALAVERLAPQLSGGVVTSEQLQPLLGGRAALATAGGKAWLAFATQEPAPRPTKGAAAAQDGVVVIAPSRADLNAALAGARQPAARYARATFDKRFAGLPAGTSARVAFDPRALLASRSPEIAATRWARSLRDGAAVLATDESGLRLPFRITADPVGLTADDLPIATGAAPPTARGSGPVVAGVRDPAHTLAFLRAAKLLPELSLVDDLPGFLKPDLGDLGPNGTLTSPALDFKRITVRAEPKDPGDWSSKLGRLDALAGVARRTGIADVDVDHRDGIYTITQNGKLAVRVAVYGRVLVLSNDPTADLRAAADARAVPTPDGAAGALTVRLRAGTVIAGLPALLSSRLGDLTGWARAELNGVTGELRLGVR